MNLFEIKNYEIQIQPEAYVLKPFRDIWDRDVTKDKSVAQAELAFVYYMADYKSDFAQELNDEIRAKDIIDNLSFLPSDWKPDELIAKAIEFYRQRQNTISILLLQDVYMAVNNLRKFYREVDLTKEDDNGKPIHDVSKLTRAIEVTGKIVDSLSSLEEKVKRDMASEAEMRGGRKKGIYEDTY